MIKHGKTYWQIGLKYRLEVNREQKKVLFKELNTACPVRNFSTEKLAQKALDKLPDSLKPSVTVHELTPVFFNL